MTTYTLTKPDAALPQRFGCNQFVPAAAIRRAFMSTA
jgi:hypothetical protein